MNIYIIRHGESLATLDPTLFGRTDPATIPLSEWGYEQAVDTGECLARECAASGRTLRVYYSPHTRIVQSKDAFLEGIGDSVDVQVEPADPLLVEREHGEFNGLDEEAQKRKNPHIYHLLHESDWYTRFTTRMPGGESLEDVQKRMYLFFDKLKANMQPDEDVVIITHGANCRMLEDTLTQYPASWINGVAPPPTGSIIHIETDLESPGTSKEILHGKKRPAHLPADYKTSPLAQEAMAR